MLGVKELVTIVARKGQVLLPETITVKIAGRDAIVGAPRKKETRKIIEKLKKAKR